MTRAEGFGLNDRTAQEGGEHSSPNWAVPGGADDAVPGHVQEAVPAEPDPVASDPVASDPRWARPALAALLVLTAVGYLWNLDRNGWGNTFYAAAVQAGTHSWSSFFFGSFDWGDYITVDKPPVSLWIMALSGRIFGFSSWSMLAPQALLGVGSVALLYAAVRRAWGAQAGLISAALLAVTPAAALMFRFNNPDAALTFLMVAAAYTLTRAVERGGTGWLVGTGVLLGTAFLAKSLQAALVLPALALAYLVCAPVRTGRRIGQLLGAGAALAVSGLWWPLLVDAIPAGSRPYIGGSTSNSVMELILGYNGLGRITGQEGGPGGGRTPGQGFGGGPVGRLGGGMGGGFGGETGWDRMVNTQFAGFIAWFLPAAVVGILAAVWLLRRSRVLGRPGRTDPRLASLLVWGGWTVVTAGVFSFATGIIHTYYTVALAPGVAALAGMTLPALWRRRSEPVARVLLAVVAVSTAGTTFWLFGRPPGWLPWLARTVLVVGVAGGLLLLLPRVPRRWAALAGAAALAAGVAGPLAWSLATIGTTHTGSIPTAGPAGMAQASFGGRGGAGGLPERFRRNDPAGGSALGGQPGQQGAVPPGQPGGSVPGGGLPTGGLPGGGLPGGGLPGGGLPGGGLPGGGAPGGPGEASTVNAELTALLTAGASGYRWVAAASSSMTAGPLQLAVNAPVMSLGGFSGGDAAITLDRFKALVAAHEVHYLVGGGSGGGPGGGRGATSSIESWVSSTFSSTTVGSTTVYDLTRPTTSS